MINEDSDDPPDIPAELKQTIGCHLWLANLELSAAITPSMLRQPSLPRHPHSDDLLLRLCPNCTQAKLDEAHLSKMLKGVVTNTHSQASRNEA